MDGKYQEHRDDPPNPAVSSANGTDTGWTVEARLAYHEPRIVAGMPLDDRWRIVHFNDKSPIGVPRASPWSVLHLCSLYEYAAAQALRWWFIAEAQRSEIGGALCLQTRLCSHRVEYSYSSKPDKAAEHIDGRGNSAAML